MAQHPDESHPVSLVFFVVSSSRSTKMVEYYLKISHHRFLQHFFQFISHNRPVPRYKTSSGEKASLNKPKNQYKLMPVE
jgi:hypothetical protein